MSIVFNKSKEISLDDETLRSDLLKIASGMDNVIALGRGDPDFHTPRHIVEAAKKALDENKHHYTPPTGLPELRKSISKNFELKYNLDYSEDEIIITAGVQESIALAMISFCLLIYANTSCATCPTQPSACLVCLFLPPQATYRQQDGWLLGQARSLEQKDNKGVSQGHTEKVWNFSGTII